MDSVIEPGTFDGTPQQLRQLVLDQIITYPETHDQGDWEYCGTTACVAGWAMLLADGFVTRSFAHPAVPEKRAAQLLGLDWYDTVRLFYTCTNDQAKAALKYLANGEPVDWETVGHKYHNDYALTVHMNHWRRIHQVL